MTTNAKTNYLENLLINHVLRATAYTSPTTIKVGLFTADPTETGSETNEVTGGGYARTVATFKTPADGVTTNNEIAFPQATGDWDGPITHFGIFDDVGGEDMIYYGQLAVAKTVLDGDVLKFLEDDLTVQEL